MKKYFTFTQENTTTHHEVVECTAIAASIGGGERQYALFVRSGEDLNDRAGVAEYVVFGWELPMNDKEFAAMCGDTSAWNSDCETLETVRFDLVKWDVDCRRAGREVIVAEEWLSPIPDNYVGGCVTADIADEAIDFAKICIAKEAKRSGYVDEGGKEHEVKVLTDDEGVYVYIVEDDDMVLVEQYYDFGAREIN